MVSLEVNPVAAGVPLPFTLIRDKPLQKPAPHQLAADFQLECGSQPIAQVLQRAIGAELFKTCFHLHHKDEGAGVLWVWASF